MPNGLWSYITEATRCFMLQHMWVYGLDAIFHFVNFTLELLKRLEYLSAFMFGGQLVQGARKRYPPYVLWENLTLLHLHFFWKVDIVTSLWQCQLFCFVKWQWLLMSPKISQTFPASSASSHAARISAFYAHKILSSYHYSVQAKKIVLYFKGFFTGSIPT